MIGRQDVYLTFPWFPRRRVCAHCESPVEHDFHLAVRFYAYLFVPLFPRDVRRIYRCRTCGGEVCITSNFIIQAGWRAAIMGVLALVAAGALAYAFMRFDMTLGRRAAWVAAWAAFAAVGFWIAVAKARKASRVATENRKPGERSFTSEIENGFWVVLPFLAFLSLMLAFGAPPLVWAGPVSASVKWTLFRAALLMLILLYWLWRRRTMPWRRVLGYAAVFAAVFTDLLGGVAPLNTFLVQLPVFAVVFALLLAAHYSMQRLARRGGRDAAQLAEALDALRSGEPDAALAALQAVSRMLDSSALRRKLDEVASSVAPLAGEAAAAGLSHVPELLESFQSLAKGKGEEGALVQRECLGSRRIFLLKSAYVCCRDEGPFGSKTRLISLTEIHPEPEPRWIWGAWWFKASLAPLALLVISTLSMLLAGSRQPASWVVLGGATVFCLVQAVMATGRKLVFHDRYRTHVQFALFTNRPSRARVNAFVDALSAAIEKAAAGLGGRADAAAAEPPEEPPRACDAAEAPAEPEPPSSEEDAPGVAAPSAGDAAPGESEAAGDDAYDIE